MEEGWVVQEPNLVGYLSNSQGLEFDAFLLRVKKRPLRSPRGPQLLVPLTPGHGPQNLLLHRTRTLVAFCNSKRSCHER